MMKKVPTKSTLRDNPPAEGACDRSLGVAIKAVRQKRRMKLAQVASVTGLSEGFLSHVERDDRGVSSDALERIAAALDVPVAILVVLGTEVRESDDSSAREIALRAQSIADSWLEDTS